MRVVIPLFPTVHFRSLDVPKIRSQEAEIWTGGVTKDDKMCNDRSKRTNSCSRYLPDGGYNEVFEWQRYIILLRRRAINTRVRSRCEEMTFLLALYFWFLTRDFLLLISALGLMEAISTLVFSFCRCSEQQVVGGLKDGSGFRSEKTKSSSTVQMSGKKCVATSH